MAHSKPVSHCRTENGHWLCHNDAEIRPSYPRRARPDAACWRRPKGLSMCAHELMHTCIWATHTGLFVCDVYSQYRPLQQQASAVMGSEGGFLHTGRPRAWQCRCAAAASPFWGYLRSASRGPHMTGFP